MAELYPIATADPDQFLSELAQAVLPVGGWAVYGASHMIWDTLDPSSNPVILQHPAYNAIMNASLEFIRSRGASSGHLTGWEWRYWVDHGGTHESWGDV